MIPTHTVPAWRRFPPAMALAMLALVGDAGCSRKDEPAAEGPSAVSVTTSVVRLGTMVDRVTASGTVVVARAAELTVFAPESAEIVEMPKQEGETVQPGDLLVRFDIASLTAALSAADMVAASASTRVETAKADLEKTTALSDKGVIPRATLEAARAELIDAQGAQSRAVGELNAVKARQNEASVHAKFAGIVARRWHQVGDLAIAAETDPVIRVVDESRLQVLAPVEKADILRLTPGRPVNIVAPGTPGEPGTVASLPAIIEAGTRTADVRFSFAAPTTLKRDAVVDVDVTLDQRPNALIVPRRAVLREDDVTYVMLAGDDNVAHRRVVQVGFSTRDEIQILSGAVAGDRVITSGLDQIGDGAAILIER